MIEGLVKHHKVKPLSRVHMMDIAKLIRNLPINAPARETVRRALANYFETVDPFFDRQRFLDIATGTLASDVKTEPYSFIKEE